MNRKLLSLLSFFSLCICLDVVIQSDLIGETMNVTGTIQQVAHNYSPMFTMPVSGYKVIWSQNGASEAANYSILFTEPFKFTCNTSIYLYASADNLLHSYVNANSLFTGTNLAVVYSAEIPNSWLNFCS